jgi:hypothetical protein
MVAFVGLEVLKRKVSKGRSATTIRDSRRHTVQLETDEFAHGELNVAEPTARRFKVGFDRNRRKTKCW